MIRLANIIEKNVLAREKLAEQNKRNIALRKMRLDELANRMAEQNLLSLAFDMPRACNQIRRIWITVNSMTGVLEFNARAETSGLLYKLTEGEITTILDYLFENE